MTTEPDTKPAVPAWARAWTAMANAIKAAAIIVAAVYLHFARPITFREIMLFAGAVLLGFGLYPIFAPAAFIVPGLVLTYVAIAGVK